jgi:hypothetical protein
VNAQIRVADLRRRVPFVGILFFLFSEQFVYVRNALSQRDVLPFGRKISVCGAARESHIFRNNYFSTTAKILVYTKDLINFAIARHRRLSPVQNLQIGPEALEIEINRSVHKTKADMQ